MAFLGLRKWPTPVCCGFCVFFLVILTSFLQIVKPLWPFMVGSAVTFYLISKAQSSGVRCTYFTHDLTPSIDFFFQLLNGAMTLATRMLPNLPKSRYTRCDVIVGQSLYRIRNLSMTRPARFL